MTGRRAYLLGLVLVAVAGVAIAVMLPQQGRFTRTSSLVSVLIGLLVQGPAGWWLVRSVGTPDFIRVWAIGILTRFAILGAMALVVFPALHWPMSPGLLLLGGVLVALLFVEAFVVWLEQSQVEAR